MLRVYSGHFNTALVRFLLRQRFTFACLLLDSFFRNPSFPQVLVLDLGVNASVHQITLMAHESKIPRRIDIALGADSIPSKHLVGPDDEVFRNVGFVKFASGEAYGHMVRMFVRTGLKIIKA